VFQFPWHPIEPSSASPSAVRLCVVETGSVSSWKPLQSKHGAVLRQWYQTHPRARSKSIVRVRRRHQLANWCFLPVPMTDATHNTEHCTDGGKGCHTGSIQHFLLCDREIFERSTVRLWKPCTVSCYRVTRVQQWHTTLHSHFAWWQAPQCSPPFQFAMSRSPRVLVRNTADNIMLLLAIFK
jgi:hypothetical protein